MVKDPTCGILVDEKKTQNISEIGEKKFADIRPGEVVVDLGSGAGIVYSYQPIRLESQAKLLVLILQMQC